MDVPGAKWRTVYHALYAIVKETPAGEPLGMGILDIAKKYDVNEKTVRRAISQLKLENLIEARPGIGITIHPDKNVHIANGKYLLFVSFRHDYNRADTKENTMIAATRKRAAEHGLNLKEVYVEHVGELNRFVYDQIDAVKPLVTENRVAGIIASFFYISSHRTEIIERLEELGAPICTIDEETEKHDAVVLDNFAIGEKIGRLLFSNPSVRRALIMRRFFYAQPEWERELGLERYIDKHKIPHARFMWMSQAPNTQIWPKRMPFYYECGVQYDALFYHSPYFHDYYEKFFTSVNWRPAHVITVSTPEQISVLKVTEAITINPDAMMEASVDALVKRIENPSAEKHVIKISGDYYYR
ncbi:MAG: hypothetical protein ABIH86_01670 [Planctomycetota bacterium]